jgi:hypothetical protein
MRNVNAIKLKHNLLSFKNIFCVLGWGTRVFTFNKNNDLEPYPSLKIWHDGEFFHKNI